MNNQFQFNEPAPKTLRPYQETAILKLRYSLASGKKRPLMQAATGAGKTAIASAMVQGALRKGKRVIFAVPAIQLIDQTVERFAEDGITCVGVIQASHEMTDHEQPVQIASIQTLMRRKNIPHADMVIIDEAHLVFQFYTTWFEQWNNIPFIGLSATPWTKGLGKLYDDLVICATTQDLIDQGYLSQFKVFAPSHPDLTGVGTKDGDYNENDLGDAMNKDALTADIVKTWRQHGENRPTICFAVNCAHAKSIQRQFESAGIACGYVDSYIDRQEREIVKQQFHAGKLKIVCNVGCLTTGVDWDVRCIILARPTKSEMLFVQMIGRGLRTANGKSDCKILDHSDTHLRLGFVTDIHHEKLCDGKPKKAGSGEEKKEPLPKECGACAFLKPPKVHECPNCGFKPEKQSDVEVIDGELKEIKSKSKKYSKEEKQNWYSELLYIARDRNYKDGWVANNYREKIGVWPVGLTKELRPASLEVQNFVRSKLIKYQKGKLKAQASERSFG